MPTSRYPSKAPIRDIASSRPACYVGFDFLRYRIRFLSGHEMADISFLLSLIFSEVKGQINEENSQEVFIALDCDFASNLSNCTRAGKHLVCASNALNPGLKLAPFFKFRLNPPGSAIYALFTSSITEQKHRRRVQITKIYKNPFSQL